ncbi:hypothetical protein RKD19_007343 [Streptomyces canus]
MRVRVGVPGGRGAALGVRCVPHGCRGLDAQQGPARDGGDQQTDQSEAEQVPGGGQAPGDQPAEPGAEHAAQAESRVETGHDGPPQRAHQIDRGTVERDVDAAVRGAEDQQHGTERRRGVGERRQGDAEGEQDGADHGDPVGAVTTAQPPREHHRDHRPGRDAEQGETEGTGGGAGLLLDRGDADDPPGEDEAVEGEEDGEGDTESGEGVLRQGDACSHFVYQRHKSSVGVCSIVGKGVRVSGVEALLRTSSDLHAFCTRLHANFTWLLASCALRRWMLDGTGPSGN